MSSQRKSKDRIENLDDIFLVDQVSPSTQRKETETHSLILWSHYNDTRSWISSQVQLAIDSQAETINPIFPCVSSSLMKQIMSY